MPNSQLFVCSREFSKGKTKLTCFYNAFSDPPTHPDLKWRSVDLEGEALPPPQGITVCSPNNWLRRILYFFNAPKRWIRSV